MCASASTHACRLGLLTRSSPQSSNLFSHCLFLRLCPPRRSIICNLSLSSLSTYLSIMAAYLSFSNLPIRLQSIYSLTPSSVYLSASLYLYICLSIAIYLFCLPICLQSTCVPSVFISVCLPVVNLSVHVSLYRRVSFSFYQSAEIHLSSVYLESSDLSIYRVSLSPPSLRLYTGAAPLPALSLSDSLDRVRERSPFLFSCLSRLAFRGRQRSISRDWWRWIDWMLASNT